jgi:O-antigen ligase
MNKVSILPLRNNQGRLFELLNQSIPFLIGIFIFFSPYPRYTTILEISFYGSVLILLILILSRKTTFSLQTPLTVPFLLFVLWCFIGLFFALNKENSINDFYAHLIKYLVIFYMLFNFFNTKEKLVILIWTIIISTAVFSAGIMIYYYLMLGNDISRKLGLGMTEISSNLIGVSTLFAILLSIQQLTLERIVYRKIILTICLCATTVAMLATNAKGTILAMIVSLLLLFPKNKKISLFLFLFITLMILVMPIKGRFSPEIMDQIRSDDRLNILYCFGEIVKDYPVFGIGFGMQTYDDESLLRKYNERVPIAYRQNGLVVAAPHNILMDIAVRTGVVGLLLFLYIIFAFVHMGWKIIKYGQNEFIRDWGYCFIVTFVAIFIQGLLENTLHGPPAIILFTIWGMMTILWRLDTDANIYKSKKCYTELLP